MEVKPINQVLAEALRYYMGARWTNISLARESGVAEGTIRNYLAPDKRNTGKTGKEPSAKLTELAKLAAALQIQVADLVTDATPEERERVLRQRAAEFYVRTGTLPSWAPASSPASGKRVANGA